MNKFIYLMLLGVISFTFSSCELKFKYDPYYFIPAYRTEKIDSVSQSVYLHKRYFVKNYRYNKDQFEEKALRIVCQAINDSVPITNLDCTFIDGSNSWYAHKSINEYIWNVKNPDTIRVMRAGDPSFKSKYIYFDCKLNKKYEQKE